MIGTDAERDALERILAVLKPILTDHKPPIAIDWVGKGAIAVGQEFESAINAVREHKDDAAIRAMLAPDDAVQVPTDLFERTREKLSQLAYFLDCGDDPIFVEAFGILDELKVLRGEATRDESS